MLPVLSRKVWCNSRRQCFLTVPPSYAKRNGNYYYLVIADDILILVPARTYVRKSLCELMEEVAVSACWDR